MKACLIISLLIVLMLMPAGLAESHEWYNEADGDYNCCNDRDCRPALDGEIAWSPLGWSVDLVDAQHDAEIIPFGWEHIYPSRDRRPHICRLPSYHHNRCLYLPEPQG